MEWPSRDRFGRTTKLLVDRGQASTPADAEEILRGYVLQIAVGAEGEFDEPSQAALLTAVNAGRRAFKGGVKVRLDRGNAEISIPWGRGLTAERAVTTYGGELVSVLDSTLPTLVIGGDSTSIDAPVLHLGWRGWVGFAEPAGHRSTRSQGLVLAGVVAAALGISEMFQYSQGTVGPGDRAVGLSLWSPASDWRERLDGEPLLEYLPFALWILGLGHLGQGSIWALGCLPYRPAEPPMFHLMDTDMFVSANLDTGLLAEGDSVGQRKTRVIAQRLEAIGIKTALVERAFDDTLRPAATEPIVALAGFDNPEARRLVEFSFPMTVDAGLGAGPNDYLDVLIHEFPSEVKAVDAFPSRVASLGELGEAYIAEISRQVAAGVPESEARCGIVEAAGATVGAAFVGAVAGALSVAAVLRQLHGGPHYSVTSLNLEEPEFSSAAFDSDPSWSERNPGFLRCDRPEEGSIVA